jgi:crotonobetainyl-CoA:carnitine CoA-transferase CaiB-like acyl-CoA transferase
VRSPLAGIEILDLGTLTPGKYCTFLLADLGAAVLRVERPPSRTSPVSSEDLLLNRGKRSITLNLREASGRAVLQRLVERADVVIESNRPGVAERLGIGYASLREQNERLVYCSLSGFGQQGPDRLRPAYDLTFMGLSGALRALVGAEAAPFSPGLYLADAVSGLTAAFSISVALLERERSGEGQYLDLSMLDSIFSILSTSHGLRRAADVGGSEAAGDGSSPLYAVYATASGGFLTLGAIRPGSCDALFAELGRPDLAGPALRGLQGEEVAGFLEQTFRTASADEWVERLMPLDIEIGQVRSPEEAFDDPQLLLRRMLVDTSHPEAGRLRQIGNPLRAAGADPGEIAAPAPALGAHTEEVLRELGFEPASISRLRAAGVI